MWILFQSRSVIKSKSYWAMKSNLSPLILVYFVFLSHCFAQDFKSSISPYAGRADIFIKTSPDKATYQFIYATTGVQYTYKIRPRFLQFTDLTVGGYSGTHYRLIPDVANLSSSFLKFGLGGRYHLLPTNLTRIVNPYAVFTANAQRTTFNCFCLTANDYRLDFLGSVGIGTIINLSNRVGLRVATEGAVPFITTSNSDKRLYNSSGYILTYSVGLVFNIRKVKVEPIAPILPPVPDGDKDGVPDEIDKCPDTLSGEKVDEQGCSTSQLDADGDGVLNVVDKCPDTPNGERVNVDGCSDSQLDIDGDGIKNNLDRCPELPGPASNEGCPVVDTVIKNQVDNIAKDVHFVTNKSDLIPASISKLNELVTILKMNPELKLIIKGHTDDIGSEENNLKLSENRVKSVIDYLAEKGIAKERMTGLAYGESKPKDTNSTEEGRANNRRVEFDLYQ
jgi:outer membrane protein OmpA-like peptidoglycan-associated protein